ncbi:class A beta-lactamase-related serine hydrolase [Leucobacter sp. UT-8R-CII-1-4]|uniref:serine hydrolase n=1 Tax=Leucobacter sp. UT-8R-CII-1-4 TaxID=3040075 RepID=UPI0024A896F5|nr:serine hydrolase [Leucobacter sp. UT-8R-CII-1-4]MDI6022099.1 class A beta-lactamase-related serine hydrolase [Leucobacter sp. UT-8R-CII-1-4]
MTNQNSDLTDLPVHAEIAAAAEAVGASVFAHAIDLETGRQVGFGSDDPTVMASVFKVPVLVEYARQVVAGELSPTERVSFDPANATLGPTGLSVFSDAAEWSLRDMATSMITVSDNAATDIVMAKVGRDRINSTMRELGLPETFLLGDCNLIFEMMAEDLGVDISLRKELNEADSDRVAEFSVCTPASTNRSTPREAAQLLRLIWNDQAGSVEACAEVRRILGLQVWPHRLRSGFPSDDIQVSGKTGTIGIVRNEIGMVEFPDGRKHAIAVFIRTNEFRSNNPDADRLIGTVGRLLSDALSVQ